MVYDSTHATTIESKKDHFKTIIVGAGLGGLAMNIRLKTQLGMTDTIVYEKLEHPYGTWSRSANTYPGAACDIPISLYSYSFAPSAQFDSQWATQKKIETYLDGVMDKFKINNVVTKRRVTSATFDDIKGIWTVKVENMETGHVDTKTSNFFVVATGALSEPNIPDFPGFEQFEGQSWHTARWNHDVDLTGKNVVLIGNGCTAAQIVPEIVDKTKTLAQVCRSRQTILPRPHVPDGKFAWILFRYVPGLMWLLRCIIFVVAESFFKVSDILRGEKLRKKMLREMNHHIDNLAPAKYKEALQPNFNVGAKRRIFDSGYYEALNRENFTLHMDDGVATFKKNSIVTKKGVEIPCDICVFATGFKVQDLFFPMEVTNGKGQALIKRMKETGAKTYKGVCVADYPNLFLIMGPNTGTGHSSVIYTIECQVNMILQLMKPCFDKIAKAQRSGQVLKPGPTVQVKPEVEDEFNQRLRQQMRKKVWEKDNVAWYNDREKGICTTLLPWSQVWYWWNTRRPDIRKEFILQ